MPHIKSKFFPKLNRKLPFGFTLIELVVVITILAILGTIGFLSIGGYSSKARDSARIWDTAQISKSLDVSIITRGNYPVPDNAFSVTYSGGVVWNQGTVSSWVMQFMKSSIAGGGLNKKPIDPLDNSEYVYSSLAYGKAYQLKVNYEGDLNQTAYRLDTKNVLINPLASFLSTTSNLLTTTLEVSSISEVQAAPGSPTIAYIRGNYGGLMAKTVTGSVTYVLAVPSIITGTGSIGAILSITDGSLSGSLLFHGRNLKIASSFNPNTVVFSGAKLPTSDISWEIATMMNNLKSVYSWATDIASVQNIATLLSMNSTGSLVSLGGSVISGQLQGGSVVSGGSTNTTDTTPPTITSITAAQSVCNTIRFTVNGASDAGEGLATTAYSFDGGATWQVSAFKDFSGTSYMVNANLIRVRDTIGNIYTHASGVSGTAASCVVNGACWGSANTCTAGTPSWYSAGSCGGSQTWSCVGVGGSTASCSIANAACAGVTCSNGYVLNTSDSNITCNSTCVFHSTAGTVIKLWDTVTSVASCSNTSIGVQWYDNYAWSSAPPYPFLCTLGLNDGLCYYASWSCSATSRRFRCVYEGASTSSWKLGWREY